ncbi:putative protein lysine methyltransferase SET5 [Colletotrichum trifolii]|uniref:SET domain-containing protein n=1 Tax=Colletotrichum trifolii TaxID=5466 RepID=A0A4R8RF34_COLTR|nr:putative protein lysine methyltransferase SET5 [Colletotrichum trifolii]
MDIKDISHTPHGRATLQFLLEADDREDESVGQTPLDHPESEDLIDDHLVARARRAASNDDGTAKVFPIPLPYLPCAQETDDLIPMLISHMKLQVHHRGKGVILRTLTPTDRSAAIMTVVEDEEGIATSLHLYNQPDEELVHGDDLMPKGTMCIVKDPCLQFLAVGEYALRVDHISDVVFLERDDPRIPLHWSVQSLGLGEENSEALCVEGEEAAYDEGNWAKAERLFTRAIAAAKKDGDLRLALYNRSLVNFSLGRLEKALQDASDAGEIEFLEDAAMMIEADILYGMGEYFKSYEYCQNLLSWECGFDDTEDTRDDAIARTREQKSGRYKWSDMHKAARSNPPRLDFATYSKPVEVRNSQLGGKGLFTKKDVKAGALLLCEKAFAYSSASENERDGRRNMKTSVNLETGEVIHGGYANLVSDIIQKLYHNPEMGEEFLDLWCGDYVTHDDTPEEEHVVDTFLVEKIVSLNCCGAPRSSLMHLAEPGLLDETTDTTFTSCGVWLKAARINHSCVPNSRRSFIGDFMIVRAARDIPANTELNFNYVDMPVQTDYDRTQEMFAKWDFVCGCRLCRDKKKTQDVFHRRRKLVDDLTFSANRAFNGTQYYNALRTITAIEDLFPDKGMWLRMDMYRSYILLGNENLDKKRYEEAFVWLLKGLEYAGFDIIANPPGRIRVYPAFRIKKWGNISWDIASIFLEMAQCYRKFEPSLVEDVMDCAVTAHAMIVGERSSFRETFQDDFEF